MPSDKKESKRSKDPSKKAKAPGSVKVEVMGKDSKRPSKKAPSLGVTPDELYGKRGKPPAVAQIKKKAPLLCPDCGAELQDGIAKCPECGLKLAEGEEMVCAVCGGVLDPSSEVCPLCGTRLTMATEEAKAHEAVPDAKIPIEDISGHHHELRKDKERPVVKVGEEEEIKIEKGPKAPKAPVKVKTGKKGKVTKRPPPKKGLLERPAIVPIAIVAFLLVAVIIVMFIPKVPMAIDGQFNDWDDGKVIKDTVPTSAAASTIVKDYSAKLQGSDVFFYMRSNGKMLNGATGTPTYAVVFVDTDNNVTTGYKVGGLGAERMLTVKGWDGSVKEVKSFSFDPASPQLDWNGFKASGTPKAKANGEELELSMGLNSLGMNKGSGPSIRFMLKTPSGSVDMSDGPVGLGTGGIAVTQYLKAPKAPVAPGTRGQVFLTLQIDAKGNDDHLASVKFTRTGQGPVGDVSLVTLWSGDVRVGSGKFMDVPGTSLEEVTFTPNLLVTTSQSTVLTLKMDLWDKASGKNLGAIVASTVDIAFKESPAVLMTVQQDEATTYINKTPLAPQIDGSFGDWNALNSDSYVYGGKGTRPEIALNTISMDTVATGHYKMAVEVTGNLMAGSSTPGLFGMNGTCTQGPACPQTGEAVVIIYIDADNKTTTGKPLGTAGADYAAIIHGKYGQVSSVGIYDYDSGKDSWELHTANGITAFNDMRRVELDLDLTKTDIKASVDTNLMVELKDGLNYSERSTLIEG